MDAPLRYPAAASCRARRAHAGIVLDLAALLQPVPHRARGAVPRRSRWSTATRSTSARIPLRLFRYACRRLPRCSAMVLHGVLRNLRDRFNLQLSLHAGARHRRDHAADVRERRHAQRPGRDAADLAHRRGDRRAAPPDATSTRRSPPSRCCSSRATGCSRTTRRARTSCSPALLAIGCFATAGRDQLAGAARRRQRGARAPARPRARDADARQPAGDRGHARRRAGARPRRAAWCSTTRRRSACSARRGCSAPSSPACCPGSASAGAAGARRRGSAQRRLRGARPRPAACACSTPAPRRSSAVLFLEDTTRSREQAQQLKLAALGRLTANIAHEIRNPLAAISHAAELLRRGAARRADRVRLTRIIHDNTQRLERLVSDVLQLNRARPRSPPSASALAAWLTAFVERVRRQRVGAARALRARDRAREACDRVRPRAPAPGAVEPAAQRGAPRARASRAACASRVRRLSPIA